MVSGRVAVGGVVAVPDMTTSEADPQVQPLAAVAQALLAAVDGRGPSAGSPAASAAPATLGKNDVPTSYFYLTS